MKATLSVTDLSKSYSIPLFTGVTLHAQAPEKIALIGENGSGKSTLLKVLAGLESSPTGSVIWSKASQIGYLEQEIGGDLDTASGGEKKLVKLSQLFYGGYDAILLDEPDNHLDLENKKWFENIVKEYEGLLIVISHDRTFLRNSVNRFWLLEEEKVNDYPFNYEQFGEIYGDAQASRKHLWETQEKERRRLEELIKVYKVRAAANTKMAKSYSGMIKRYDRFVENMVPKPKEVKTLGFGVKLEKQPAKKTALHLTNLSKSYGKKSVLRDLSVHIFCGEKVAINAPNGSGKSTLLNIISDKLKADSGEVYIGPNLKVGYYTQEHLESLEEDKTLVEELQKSLHLHHYDAISYLKRFLFTPSQIEGQVKYLSGGQKSRLQLAKFLGLNPDILILDEPTNHLDLKTVLALEKFLISYTGTLVLVSHDKELVEHVVTKNYSLEDGVLAEI